VQQAEGNKRLKKLWSTTKYKEQSDSDSKEMENMLNEVINAFLAVMKGHANKSFAVIIQEL
jgi:hypothetical protein